MLDSSFDATLLGVRRRKQVPATRLLCQCVRHPSLRG